MTKLPLDNRPHLKVKINNQTLTALLDTGAMNSIIGKNGIKLLNLGKIKIDPSSDVNEIKVANGAISKVLGILNLAVKLGNFEKKLKFLVVPNLSYDFILGADFCNKFELSLHFKNYTWQIPYQMSISAISESTDNTRQLDKNQSLQLELVKEKFKSLATGELGCAKGVVHVIDTQDAKPIKQRQYPLSPYMQTKLHAEIDQMLKDQVIQESKSPWCSPLVLITKKNGEIRTCFDGRKLNFVTVRDSYPLPRTDCILNRLRNAKFLSSIDLKKAFWQIPLEESSRPKTAFCVPGKGLFEFKVMPFGLSNSASTLQRAMEHILGSVLHKQEAFVYLDDIIIASPTFEEHIQTLTTIYEKLNEAGFKVNFDKCEFCKESITFLGFIVDENGLRTDPEKVSAINRFKTPKTTTEVKRLIGLISYYRVFLPNLSTISSPITALIKSKKKGQTIKWTPEAESAFEKIKELITCAPILVSPDFGKPFFIQTDASAVGVGAVLFQEQGGLEHPIAYASRALTSAEQKYGATERELIAVMFGISKYRCYVEGTKFFVYSDNSALKWLEKLSNPSGRLSRWSLYLSSYDFEIRHRPGKLNVVPDVLSRDIASINVPNLIADEWYKNMIEKVELNPDDFPNFKVQDNKLFKFIPSKLPVKSNVPEWKLVVPTENRKEILNQCHDDPKSAHFGVSKTLARVCDLYYWPKMKKEIVRYVSNCNICDSQKSPNQSRPGLMGQYKNISFPFQLISVDLLGPFPRSSKGNQHLLVVTDWFTKFVLVQPLVKATAKAVVKFMENQVFLIFGVPQIVLCDNGVQFVSREFKQLITDYKVQKIWFNAKYHPQNNPTERVNRVLVAAISSYIKNDHKKWDENIFKIAQAIRTAKHDVTKFSPSYLTFGRYVPTSGEFFGQAPNKIEIDKIQEQLGTDESHQQIPELYRQVRDKLKKSYENSKKRYDLRKRPVTYNANDKVWKKNHVLSDAKKFFSAKLAPKYVLCTVNKKVGQLSYELTNDKGQNIGIFHVKDLKPYRGEDK